MSQKGKAQRPTTKGKRGQAKMAKKIEKKVERHIFVNPAAVQRRVLNEAPLSRKTIGKTKNKTLRKMMRIEEAIVAPGVVPAPRFSNAYSNSEIAAANPWEMIDVPWIAQPPASEPADRKVDTRSEAEIKLEKYLQQAKKEKKPTKIHNKRLGSGPTILPETTALTILSRNPVRNRIIYDALNNTGYTYDAFFCGSDGSAPTVNLNIDETMQGRLPIAYLKCRNDTTYSPHGLYMFLGSHNEDVMGTWFWMDNAADLTFSFASLQAMNQIDFQIDMWQNGNISDGVATVTCSNANPEQIFNPTVSAYYRVKIRELTAWEEGNPPLQIAYSKGGSESTYRHLPIPGLAEKITDVQAIRNIGSSVMFSNSAPMLNRNGYVYGRQVPKDMDWTSFAVTDPASLTGLAKTQKQEAENGMYGFMLPSSEEDLEFITPFNYRNGVFYGCSFPLKEHSAYIVMRAEVPLYTGRAAKFTWNYAVNFETTDTWFDARPAPFPKVFQEALVNLRKFEGQHQFYCNPLHISDILDKIRGTFSNIVGGVAKYAPMIGQAAEAIAPLLAGA